MIDRLMKCRSLKITEQKGIPQYLHILPYVISFSFIQAEVDFDYKLKDEKQMLSANLTNLQMQASHFPDVTKTSYKVT